MFTPNVFVVSMEKRKTKAFPAGDVLGKELFILGSKEEGVLKYSK